MRSSPNKRGVPSRFAPSGATYQHEVLRDQLLRDCSIAEQFNSSHNSLTYQVWYIILGSFCQQSNGLCWCTSIVVSCLREHAYVFYACHQNRFLPFLHRVLSFRFVSKTRRGFRFFSKNAYKCSFWALCFWRPLPTRGAGAVCMLLFAFFAVTHRVLYNTITVHGRAQATLNIKMSFSDLSHALW